MIKFLVIAQDLRVSGTSEGIVSRSFIGKLRKAYPDSIIDVLYLKKDLKSYKENRLELLPVDSIESKCLNLKIPFSIKFLNKIYWRLFNSSLKEKFIQKKYASQISNIKHENYNHIFVRSSGLNYETILALKGLPIIKKAIINFHDPYPLFWYSGSSSNLTKLELFRLKYIIEVASQVKSCMSPSKLLSRDLQFLYGDKKFFGTLPHQFDKSVFDLSNFSKIKQKNKRITISYQGAIMFGRNIDVVLDAYTELLKANKQIKDNTDFVLRLKGQDNERLIKKYKKVENIQILDVLNFSNSFHEQANFADIIVILENGPEYSNVLVGKAPVISYLNKPFLCVSPIESEMHLILNNEKYIAHLKNKDEIKLKLEQIINDVMNNEEFINPLKNYFSLDNFKSKLNSILNNS